MATRLSSIQVLRRVTLGVILVGLIIMTVLHQKAQGIPSIDALDPFGGLETLMKFVAGGEFIKKIEPGNIVMLGAVVALGIVLSRFFRNVSRCCVAEFWQAVLAHLPRF